MTLDDFLTLPLHERIKWLHGKDGPEGKMSHDTFAKRLGGTSRQVIISWEKPGGAEPEPRLAEALHQFSRFPVAAFSRREAEQLVYESFGRRLRELEAFARLTLRGLEAVDTEDDAALRALLAEARRLPWLA